MLFSKRLPLAQVIELCRALRHNLSAGITLRAVFKQQAERGPPPIRALADRVALRLQQGEALAVALEHEKELFPPLFLTLAHVGEETGSLPEVFAELEKYFSLQLKLRRQFISQSMLPAIQFVLALFVIAGLILILGLIASSRGGPRLTIFGLSGPIGSLIFLSISFGGIAALYLAYRLVPGMLSRKSAVDAWLLKVPSLGPCLYAFVMGRFTMALQLTTSTGMTIMRALKLSLRATGNASFAAKADEVAESLKAGDSLCAALSRTGIFNADFMNIVAVAEESGRITEVMRQQADYWHEEAGRKLTVLTRLSTMAVWLVYAIFMVAMIFRIASIYLNALGV